MHAVGLPRGTDLARASGVSQGVISRWLSGDTAPDLTNLRRVSKPLKLSLLELAVAAGLLAPEEARMRDAPKPPAVPVGANVDPEVLAALAEADPAALEAVRAVLRATKR